MAAKRSAVLVWFWKIHPRIYRWTKGRLGGTLLNMPVLLLTTKGRRSGQPRTKALMYLPEGDRCVVIASKLGEPQHPDWWLNLKTNPQAEIEIRGQRTRVTAREAEGAERERLWTAVVSRQPDYAEYQARTRRRIPVVVLDPQG